MSIVYPPACWRRERAGGDEGAAFEEGGVVRIVSRPVLLQSTRIYTGIEKSNFILVEYVFSAIRVSRRALIFL